MSRNKPKPFKDNMIVINMSSHKFPSFKEVEGKEWIYYGEKNNYPQYLLDLYYKCSKHNAIVNGKAKYVAGVGWEKAGDVVVNLDNQNLNDFTYKVALDRQLYNGRAIEVIWNNGGTGAEFRHVDFSKVRSNKDNTKFFYTSKWQNKYGSMKTDPENNEDWEVYEPFDPNSRKGKQLIYYKCYSPGLETYPLPEYKAALLYIELEYEISNYWFNRVKNGFMPSAIINFYMGQPTDDEMKKIEQKVRENFAGTDNSGQFIVNFSSGKDFAADVQQLNPPELGVQYTTLNDTVQQEIFTGHNITSPMLFGIKTPGQLGGRTELIEQSELLQNWYVNPIQLETEIFFAQYIFPYIKGMKGEMKLRKQDPIGYQFSESVMVKYLPEKAISEMIAKKMSIDLTKYPEFEKERKEKKEAELKPQRFSKDREKIILAELKKKAKKRNGKVLYKRSVTYEMSKNLKDSEQEMVMKFAEEKKIAPVIIGKPTSTPTLKPVKAPTEIISVVYYYDWIEGFSDADADTSREFCIDLMAMSKAGERWTREDIETISTTGYDDTWSGAPDIWSIRGGWYTRPNTDIHIPHCRHEWVQEVIREII